MSTFKYNRLDKSNVAVLLVDHQTGLTNRVQDFSPSDFKNNVLAFRRREILQGAGNPYHELRGWSERAACTGIESVLS